MNARLGESEHLKVANHGAWSAFMAQVREEGEFVWIESKGDALLPGSGVRTVITPVTSTRFYLDIDVCSVTMASNDGMSLRLNLTDWVMEPSVILASLIVRFQDPSLRRPMRHHPRTGEHAHSKTIAPPSRGLSLD